MKIIPKLKIDNDLTSENYYLFNDESSTIAIRVIKDNLLIGIYPTIMNGNNQLSFRNPTSGWTDFAYLLQNIGSSEEYNSKTETINLLDGSLPPVGAYLECSYLQKSYTQNEFYTKNNSIKTNEQILQNRKTHG